LFCESIITENKGSIPKPISLNPMSQSPPKAPLGLDPEGPPAPRAKAFGLYPQAW